MLTPARPSQLTIVQDSYDSYETARISSKVPTLLLLRPALQTFCSRQGLGKICLRFMCSHPRPVSKEEHGEPFAEVISKNSAWWPPVGKQDLKHSEESPREAKQL